jgi:hypothetical protein
MSPTTARRLLAIKTGQKFGQSAMTAAPVASTARAATIKPRLARVESIKAPAGVCRARPMRPPIVVTRPTSDRLQCCRVTR